MRKEKNIYIKIYKATVCLIMTYVLETRAKKNQTNVGSKFD